MLRFLDSIKVLSAHDMLLPHQKLRNITVQLPLDIFKIEFYDWMNAEITSYDIMRSEWIEHGKITRFPSRFRILMNDTNIIKIGDKYIDKQTTALLFRSGTVWKKENIAQLCLCLAPFLKKTPSIFLSFPQSHLQNHKHFFLRYI